MCIAVRWDWRRFYPELYNDLSEKLKSDINHLLLEFDNIFNNKPGLSKIGRHRILVKTDIKPFKCKQYRLHPDKQKVLDADIQKLIALDLIQESQSSFASPCMPLDKPDGGVGLIIDFRQLNSQCDCQSFPIGRINDLIDKIGQSKFLTKLDTTKAYWNVKLEEESLLYNAFITRNGFFEWKVLPFGLSGACATFNRIVNKLLERFRHFTFGYFDDALIFSSSWPNHLLDVSNVLKVIKQAGLNLNRDKCEFGKAVTYFLGFRVGLGRIELRQRKVEAIVNCPRPTSKKQISQWCDLASYYQKFLHILRLLLPYSQTCLRKQLVYLVKWSWCCFCGDNVLHGFLFL